MMQTAVMVSAFESIDDVLGDSQFRFFGSGFQSVSHRISEVHVRPAEREVTAVAGFTYPPGWSRKSSGELKPHLSSIDGLVVSIQLAEAYLRHTYGIGDGAAANMWLRKFTMKAGAEPTRDLGAVSAKTTLLATTRDAGSTCGYLSRLVSQVGTMGVDMVVDHPVFEGCDAPAESSNIERLLGPQPQRYYGAAYRTRSLRVRDVQVDRSNASAGAVVEPREEDDSPRRIGLGSAHSPFLSPVDAIVAIAQLAQVVLYAYDGIDRRGSGNLWMRRISCFTPHPTPLPSRFEAEAWIAKTTLVAKHGQTWRTATFGVSLPAMESDCTLAHQLPQN